LTLIFLTQLAIKRLSNYSLHLLSASNGGNEIDEILHFYLISPVHIFPGIVEADIWRGGN